MRPRFGLASRSQRTAFAFSQMVGRSDQASTRSPAVPLRNDRGVVLLEVLVAVVVLTIAGLSLVETVGAGLRAEREAREREGTLASEERLLAASTMLNRTELAQRIGRREIGEFIIDVRRPEQTLYRIAVLRGDAPQVEDLVTVVYRKEPPR